jgi:hypothetical protein
MTAGPSAPVRREALLLANDATLLAQCEVDRYRASGPGGQHRNKTESAVRIRHLPTGVQAIAEDSRSQAENKEIALRRVRAQFALRFREPVALESFAPSPRLAAMVAGGTARLGEKTRQTPEFWIAMGELLDVFLADGCEVRATADRLGIGSSALSKLLLRDDGVARVVNEERAQRGLRPMR